MKKIVSLLIVLAMVLGLGTALVSANDSNGVKLLITAGMLADEGNTYVGISSHALMVEGDIGENIAFARFTAENADPNVYILPLPKTDVANKYAVYKYRTSDSGVTSTFYTQAAEPRVKDVVLEGDGEWHIGIVDCTLSPGDGTNTNWNGNFQRLDPSNQAGVTVDYAWIALFSDREKAEAYKGPSPASKVNLDGFKVSSDPNTNYNTMASANDEVHITYTQGESLTALGWAFKYGTNLKRVYWQYFGKDSGSKFANEPIQECSNNYRSRNDVADYFGYEGDYKYFTKSGFGNDNGFIELVGTDKLDPGQYYMRLVAEFEDGTTEVIKKKFLVEVKEGVPTVQPTVSVNGKEVKPNAVSQVELSMDGNKLVATTVAPQADSPADPWISIPLDNIDTSEFESVTVVYSIEGNLHGNNVYLCDTEFNPGYSGKEGTWCPPDMNGKTEKTFVFATDFAPMNGKILTGIRFPGAAEVGSKLVIESITFNRAAAVVPQPQTSDASLVIFVIAAAAIALVILKKKAF